MSLFDTLQQQINGMPIQSDPFTGFVRVAEAQEISVFRNAEGEWLYRLNQSHAPAALKVSADYSHIVKQLGVPEEEMENFRFLLRTAFECRFCHQGIVSLHAACVEKDGFAVAFTGYSGLGKSTRAGAWVEGLGASWMSGDRPAVRLEKDGCTACGVPWDGKEQIFCDNEAPLKCILDVRRSHVNYVRKLTPAQARLLLAQQTFIPMWDTDTAVLALSNIRRMVKLVPVYRVFCGRTPDDARAIYNILYNHPEQIREETEDMKIKKGFVLRNVVDEYMIMPTGDNIAKFDGTAVLNEVSAFVFKKLQNAVSRDDLLTAILDEFDVDEQTAAKDLDNLLAKFRELNLIEE